MHCRGLYVDGSGTPPDDSGGALPECTDDMAVVALADNNLPSKSQKVGQRDTAAREARIRKTES